jgi:Helix-turn-helix domain/Phage derived protein Gp49-like (DUF891)
LLGEPYTRQLDGKLRELRFHLERRSIRITYWIATGRRIVLLTVFHRTRMREVQEIEGRAGHSCDASPRNTRLRTRSESMSKRASWEDLRNQRMAEPGAAAAYESARLAYELGRPARAMREQRGWSQAQVAKPAGMTQSAVARFEAGGTTPTLPCWNAWRWLSTPTLWSG